MPALWCWQNQEMLPWRWVSNYNVCLLKAAYQKLWTVRRISFMLIATITMNAVAKAACVMTVGKCYLKSTKIQNYLLNMPAMRSFPPDAYQKMFVAWYLPEDIWGSILARENSMVEGCKEGFARWCSHKGVCCLLLAMSCARKKRLAGWCGH